MMKGYPGNKNIPGLIHKIVNNIPCCSTVIEIFAGSAGLYRYLSDKTHSPFFWLNDIDKHITADLALSHSDPNSKIKITNRNAFDIVQELLTVEASKDVFIFMDPPYLLHTRNNRKYYKHEFTDQDHEDFLNLVVQLKCSVMLIHPVCELYDTKLSDFRKVQLKVRYRAKTATECLYMNYPVPAKKLIYDTVGIDCWDRQRIKRKGDRTVKRILSLPPVEREYIINRIKTEVL